MSQDSSKESPLTPGSKLDGYELLWPIGEGGMATVWVARLLRKHGFEKLVAIKTILPKFAEDEAFQTMFLDEARIASRIDHTNVAHIHDLGEKDDVLYLVMEYVDGDALTRLRKMVNRKGIQFPIGIALRIMADVCSGLHAAHELKGADGKPLGVVHRDVSPQNILVTTEGTAKVIDFGVAKAAGRLTAETHTGYVKGKVQYMAPEQALGKNVDRRADVWAVGAVIYHLIANRPPFEADNQLALLNLLQKGRPPSPLPPHVPITVQDIVKKALTHNPMMRFQTTAEMRSAIEKTGLVATPEEVADFARQHMGELADRRRAAISAAMQGLEGTVAQAAPAVQAPPPAMNMPPPYGGTDPGGASATQRIDPQQLPPQFQVNQRDRVRNVTGPHRVTGPHVVSEPRIGPPTPQSFMAAPNESLDPAFAITPPPISTGTPRRTEPVALPMSSLVSPNPPSPPAFSSAVPASPTAATEPLPPPEALYDNAFNDNTNGGGSLGLASISASINTKRPRNVPLIAGGIGGAVVLIGVLALAVSVSRGGATNKKLESEFSPLPSATTATETPVTAPVPAPAPPPVDELPATSPAPAPVPAPTIVEKPIRPTVPVIAPSPAPHPAPPTVAPAPAPRPAPAGSAKKKPAAPSGPPGPDGF